MVQSGARLLLRNISLLEHLSLRCWNFSFANKQPAGPTVDRRNQMQSGTCWPRSYDKVYLATYIKYYDF